MTDETANWTVRRGHQKDDLFICEEKGLARVARLWNGRTDRERSAYLLASAPLLKRELQALVEEIERDRAVGLVQSSKVLDRIESARIALSCTYPPVKEETA